MTSELPEDPLKVTPAEDQHVVEALPACRPYPPLREGVCLRGPDRRLDDFHPLGPENLVERTGVLRVPVSDQAPDARSRSPTARFRACWVTHAESGFLVTPRTCTLRDPSSMPNSTYMVRSQTGSTVKKSNARMPRAWARRNSLHDGLLRRGAGPRPSRRRTVRIAVADTRIPSFI